MSNEILFVHLEGKAEIVEVPMPERVVESEIYMALEVAGLLGSDEVFVFVDEAEEHISRDCHDPAPGTKHGVRIHITRHRRIEVKVHFLEKTIERAFSPGARVRKVKEWAAKEFHVSHKDAAEHVLQICHSSVRPVSDTPLHALLHDRSCSICFDFVPEKRVEGYAW
jgi:hypothetical protein